MGFSDTIRVGAIDQPILIIIDPIVTDFVIELINPKAQAFAVYLAPKWAPHRHGVSPYLGDSLIPSTSVSLTGHNARRIAANGDHGWPKIRDASKTMAAPALPGDPNLQFSIGVWRQFPRTDQETLAVDVFAVGAAIVIIVDPILTVGLRQAKGALDAFGVGAIHKPVLVVVDAIVTTVLFAAVGVVNAVSVFTIERHILVIIDAVVTHLVVGTTQRRHSTVGVFAIDQAITVILEPVITDLFPTAVGVFTIGIAAVGEAIPVIISSVETPLSRA